MKVGDYVRIINTLEEYVEITKIKNIWSVPLGEGKIMLDNRGYEYDCDEIEKSSSNILDLIEVGDYIDGHEVYRVTPSCIFTRGGINYHKDLKEIKSIVTKEQFHSMEYIL